MIIENNNPVCDSLYLKQGWVPFIDEPETIEVVQTTEEVKDEQPDNIEIKLYKKGDFTTLSIEKIKELAESHGYTINATKKADIIEEFLSHQK